MGYEASFARFPFSLGLSWPAPSGYGSGGKKSPSFSPFFGEIGWHGLTQPPLRHKATSVMRSPRAMDRETILRHRNPEAMVATT